MSNLTHEVIEQMDRDELVTACKALVDRMDGQDDDPALSELVVKLSTVITSLTIEYGLQDACACGNPRWEIAVDLQPDAGTYVLLSERHDDHTRLTVEQRSAHHHKEH